MEPGTPDAGGEAACWLHLVCPDCGRLNAAVRPSTCEACGAEMDDAEVDDAVWDDDGDPWRGG